MCPTVPDVQYLGRIWRNCGHCEFSCESEQVHGPLVMDPTSDMLYGSILVVDGWMDWWIEDAGSCRLVLRDGKPDIWKWELQNQWHAFGQHLKKGIMVGRRTSECSWSEGDLRLSSAVCYVHIDRAAVSFVRLDLLRRVLHRRSNSAVDETLLLMGWYLFCFVCTSVRTTTT